MSDAKCVSYPDIFEDPKRIDDTDRYRAVVERNYRRARLYGALRYVMDSSEMLCSKVAEWPDQFGKEADGEVTDGERARFLATFGMLVTDNWEDPSLNKKRASGDDKVIEVNLPPMAMPRDENGNVAKDVSNKVIVTDRFTKAVLKAVHEHSKSPELYEKVYLYLRTGTLTPKKSNGAPATSA